MTEIKQGGPERGDIASYPIPEEINEATSIPIHPLDNNRSRQRQIIFRFLGRPHLLEENVAYPLDDRGKPIRTEGITQDDQGYPEFPSVWEH